MPDNPSPPAPGPHTHLERLSDTEMQVTRHFAAPPRLAFAAWTEAELFRRWWVPPSLPIPLLRCEMDVRTGGSYRLVFGMDDGTTMAFFGRYLEATPPSRLVWTNDEDPEAPVTTVTFEEHDGGTRLVLHELYPSPQALEAGLAGSAAALPEQFAELDALLATAP
ncbi:ATPase [alpha proteobacterium AAP81b]|nr:ATPase [alpha proteobacterium AAP81b]